eukprot:8010579-Alexandrium_andersonii.AAC.1
MAGSPRISSTLGRFRVPPVFFGIRPIAVAVRMGSLRESRAGPETAYGLSIMIAGKCFLACRMKFLSIRRAEP